MCTPKIAKTVCNQAWFPLRLIVYTSTVCTHRGFIITGEEIHLKACYAPFLYHTYHNTLCTVSYSFIKLIRGISETTEKVT